MKSIYSYQSANLTDDEVVGIFIVRKKEFQRIISEIKRDDMTASIQHYLIVGRRGSGKSTLLRRIQAEVNKDKDLSKRLVVVNLSEEQAGVYRLLDLWDLVIRELNSQNIYTDEPDWTDFENNLNDYIQALYKSIQKALNQQNKKLLLLLDNIDRIFDNIGDDAHFLRELLINHKDIRVIGGSTRIGEHYWKYDKPFYEFFRIIRLESLKSEEVRELLSYWSECLDMPDIEQFIIKNPGKIETVRVLTDGMPRTLLYFLEILIDRQNQNGFEFLRMIIDRATPIYQERLNILPPAQRKIVIELSNFWDAVKVKSLIDVCKMPGKIISAHLNQLVKVEIVEKIATGKKDKLYRLSERFFNLWLLMTQGGPKEKRQVKYLTVFLENWYGKEGLTTIYNNHIEGLVYNKLKPDYADTNRYDEAEKYFLQAIKNGHRNALNSLALMYYFTNRNKNQAIELMKEYIKNSSDLFGMISYVRILLWAGQMEEFNSQIQKLIPEMVGNDEEKKLAILFIELLIHKQYNIAWQWFKDAKLGNKIKEILKPIYYVTASLSSHKEQAEELLKSGPELEDSIKQLNEYISEKQKIYYI